MGDITNTVSTTVSNQSAGLQVDNYLKQPCMDETSNPINIGVELSQLACKYLALPASSTPVKRLLSVVGNIFRPDRCRTDKRFEELMFLRSNYYNTETNTYVLYYTHPCHMNTFVLMLIHNNMK